MAHQYRMSKNLIEAIRAFEDARNEFEGCIDVLQTALLDEVTEHRDAFADMSERWLNSERAGEVEAWVEQIEQAESDLEQISSSFADFQPADIEVSA